MLIPQHVQQADDLMDSEEITTKMDPSKETFAPLSEEEEREFSRQKEEAYLQLIQEMDNIMDEQTVEQPETANKLGQKTLIVVAKSPTPLYALLMS